jgi:dihydroflavonol-4-reductase
VLALPDEPTTNLDGLDVEILRGNVLRSGDATRAVEGVETVFHAAAIYKDWAPDPTPMYEVNLRGTFNMLEAARRANVSRVVYTASIVSLGRPGPLTLGDENTPYEAWDLDFAYSRSKYLSRMLAEDFASWGLDVRVVCPAVVLGPGDITPTPSGKIIVNALRLRSGVYTTGGIAYVDVRDAAAVHVLAAERGQRGQRYIASAHNLTNGDLLRAIFDAAGLKPRMVKVPFAIALGVARAVERTASRRGAAPPMASAMLAYSEKPGFYSNRRAVDELGATFRPLDETLRDAIAYFRARGLVS